MELVIKNITPAIVDMNIAEVEKYMAEVKEKYQNIIFSADEIKFAAEERAKLNKLEKNIADVRKRIEKEGMATIKSIIDTLKQAEKDTKALSENINNQIKEFKEREWEAKQEEISEIIDNVFRENPELKLYLSRNDKWRDKKMTLAKIESEIEEQFEKLEKKQGFIKGQIEAVNEEIENKIKFEDVQYLMNAEFDEIMKTLVTKKNEIKVTEENIRKRAEEEKQRAIEEAELKKQKELAELEERKEREKQEAVKKAQNGSIQAINETDKENIKEVEKKAVSGKFFDTTIRFKKAPLEFLKELKKLSDSFGLEYELIENIEL